MVFPGDQTRHLAPQVKLNFGIVSGFRCSEHRKSEEADNHAEEIEKAGDKKIRSRWNV